MIRQVSDDLLWSQIVAKAWCDDALMSRLVSDPRKVLVEHGMKVPECAAVLVTEGEEALVLEETDSVRHFSLPKSPPDDLFEEDIVEGAVSWCGCGACAACGACGRCGCRCACRCF